MIIHKTNEDLRKISAEEAEEGESDFHQATSNNGTFADYNPRKIYIVVGGYDALPSEFPFMVALGYGTDTNKTYMCGGSLISEEYVLTAAHCIFSPESGIVKYIRLGERDIKSSHDDVNVKEYKMSTYHIHPNYSFSLKYNDIALIKMDQPVNFTYGIKPVCLEHERKSLKYRVLHATGWGLLGYGEPASAILQAVKLRQYTPKSCQKTYNSDPGLSNGFTDDHQICAGTITNITDTCEGDSGGPLFYFSKRNGPRLHYLVGITSFGVPCGFAELPAVYTRVSYYLDWIENIVWPEI